MLTDVLEQSREKLHAQKVAFVEREEPAEEPQVQDECAQEDGQQVEHDEQGGGVGGRQDIPGDSGCGWVD